ncbi:TlpA disulfide reductase family protein [Sphingobacterium sp. CZ-2]|uniref:TlpA disulfide reductase family protein n=1 Tax=Sphingobacterium sp. CZ-2 TaxID=2557994 RepID=UPI00106FB15E|nr:TlpA disulfide reductase family protein [Sphingobacterium sp. CZ-2]QBR13246.1 TlpA family protein disulfide reductase [Sphingobacterium sp. CZ-2]
MNTFIWGRRGLPKKSTLSVLSIIFYLAGSAQSNNQFSSDITNRDSFTIRVGQQVPKDFWNQKHLLYEDGSVKEITLNQFRGKKLILDFWSIGCGTCISHQKNIDQFKLQYKDDIVVLMVNSRVKSDTVEAIKRFESRFKEYFPNGLKTIILDDKLNNYFHPIAYPTYVWINRLGIIEIITFRNLLNTTISPPFLPSKSKKP